MSKLTPDQATWEDHEGSDIAWCVLNNVPPIKLQEYTDSLDANARYGLTLWMERIACASAAHAAYLSARQERPHAYALKRVNRAARMVWVKVFGYNEHRNLPL